MLVKKTWYSSLAILLLALTSYVMAADVETKDGYVIHYNAINTTFLTPETAKRYQITRSKKLGMLNVSVRKGENPAPSKAVTAVVKAQAVNLNSQLKTLDMPLIEDGGAIYYIDTFAISNGETLKFTVTVDPESKGKEHKIEFEQQFFVD